MASTHLCLSTAPIFSGDDYDCWATIMQHLLKAIDLWDLVEKGFETPVANEQLTEEQQKISKKNEEALYILKSRVSRKILPLIKDATTAKEAWTILQKYNQDTKKKEVIDWMGSMKAMQYHSGERSNISSKSAVPEKLRKENEDSYKPKVVSIGPRFRGSTRDLLKMEKTKWKCISSLLDGQENAESNLAKCGELLEEEKEVLESYVDDPKLLKSRDMANILLYDAYFMLELLNGGIGGLFFNSSLSFEECEKVLSDLLVLDNQIPFSILRKLYLLLFGETDDSIETLALDLFGFDVPGRILLSDTKNSSNFVELVHSFISMDLKDGQEREEDVRPVQQDDSQESNQLIPEIREDITAIQLDDSQERYHLIEIKEDVRPIQQDDSQESNHRILEIKEDVRPAQQDDSQESNQLIPEIRDDVTPVQQDDRQEGNQLIPEIREDVTPVQLDDSQESNILISEIQEGIKHVQLDRCATMLRAAGVKINPLVSDDNELQPLAIRIRFNKSTGTLHIPELFITETTKARWLNLIAWEHHKMGASGTFICKCTSAALFFNALICCESDVQLLKDRGIIEVDDDMRMSNKDLVTFFRSIKGGIDQDKINSRYNIFNVLNKHYSHPTRHITQIPLRFWHYLTGSPREVLRDLHNNMKRGYNYAVSLITILSLLSTIYAVLSYYHPKK